MGVFESTRYARGHKALKTFELNGADGSVAFDLHDSQWLEFFEYTRAGGDKVEGHLAGWRRIHVTSFEHPYMDHWWVPGLTIGYEHSFVHALADFLRGVETGKPAEPTFPTALRPRRCATRCCGRRPRASGSRRGSPEGAQPSQSVVASASCASGSLWARRLRNWKAPRPTSASTAASITAAG